jgi:hypothetical protein
MASQSRPNDLGGSGPGYKWPGIDRRPCSRVGPFTLAELNAFLASSRYVGSETIEGAKPRRVHHFRVGVVWEPPPEVLPPGLITPVGGNQAGSAGEPKLRGCSWTRLRIAPER